MGNYIWIAINKERYSDLSESVVSDFADCLVNGMLSKLQSYFIRCVFAKDSNASIRRGKVHDGEWWETKKRKISSNQSYLFR